MNARTLLPIAALLSANLAAQDFEFASMGVQARLSKAEADLKDITGSSDFKLPGFGVSLLAEVDLFEGYRARMDIGVDQWRKGDWEGQAGIEGTVSAYHVGVEGLLMLKPDESPARGPYLLAGLGGYAWTVKRDDSATGSSTTRRVTHVAGSVGMGFRLNSTFDVELKILAGRIDPELFASAIQASMVYRFNP